MNGILTKTDAARLEAAFQADVQKMQRATTDPAIRATWFAIIAAAYRAGKTAARA